MSEGFSGEPRTRWDGPREMILLEPFSYVDPDGKTWTAPAGSRINGASIPRALWTAVGAPYAGEYRRASVVHDWAVQEFGDTDVSPHDRKAADRMFYHACRSGGCSRRFAAMLYIGVRMGAWIGGQAKAFRTAALAEGDEVVRTRDEFDACQVKFWTIADEAGPAMLDEEDLDALDAVIDKHLGSGTAP